MKRFIPFLVIILAVACTNEQPRLTAEAERVDSTAVVLNAIAKRHSVRNFTEQRVSADTLQMLARAGMAAPTACNKQPWAVMAIDEREVLDTLFNRMGYRESMQKAQAAIVVCGDMSKTLEDVARDFWIQDCSAMTENILVAAQACGLGAVWTGVYPIEERVEIVRTTFCLPEQIVPLCVILVGHPVEGADEVKDKWVDKNYHYNRW